MNTKKGFTLVELIVVVTILAILATVGYISFLGYASFARDGARLTDISMIRKALEYHKTKGYTLPTPDNGIPITISGSIVGYQGDAGQLAMGTIGISGGKDPLDGNYYSYFLRKNHAQVLALFENEQNQELTNTNKLDTVHADNIDRYPFFKGWGLGMFLETDNTPIHQSIDVKNAGEFDILDTGFMSREVQPLFTNKDRYTTRAIMIGGQLSVDPVVIGKKICPEHYIPVPGNKEVGQPPFCIGKYEAYSSNDNTTGTYHTAPDKQPVIRIDATTTTVSDFRNCTANGDKYHIMTMMEWLTIARNIEMMGSNWTGGEVGSGYLIGGNNSDDVTGFDLLGVKLKGGDDSRASVTQNKMRKLTLSNGEVLWDFVGNVAELVKGLNNYTLESNGLGELYYSTDVGGTFLTAQALTGIEGISNATYTNWEDITDTHFKSMYGPRSGANTNQGIGAIIQYNTRIFAMGGYAVSSHSTTQGVQGLYSMVRFSGTNSDEIGTRCAYSY